VDILAFVLAALALTVAAVAFKRVEDLRAAERRHVQALRENGKDLAAIRNAVGSSEDRAAELKLVKAELSDFRRAYDLAAEGMPTAVRLIAREAVADALIRATDSLSFERQTEDTKGA
jgi:hypothetical protein